ncbi:MAG: caspase family protein [Bacteroidota bacterium]
MKNFSFGILYFITLTLAYSQNQQKADSLINLLNAGTQTQRFELLAEISIYETRPDSLLKYSNFLISETSDSQKNWKYHGYFQKGNAYRLKGDYDLAFKNYFEALQWLPKSASGNMASVHTAIGDTYSVLGDSRNALDFYLQGISQLRISKDSVQLATALLNTGDEYLRIENLDSALILFTEADIIFKRKHSEIGESYAMGNMGLVFAKQGRYEMAEISVLEAIEHLDELGDTYAVSAFQLEMAGVYKELGLFKAALGYSLDAYDYAIKFGLKEQIRDAAELLSQIYEATGKSKKALDYLRMYVAYRDSLNNESIIQQMADIRRDFELAKIKEEGIQKSVATPQTVVKISDVNPDYYALIIGINDYQYNDASLLDLDHPVSDGLSLSKALLTGYFFDQKKLFFLENPTRSEIIQTLEQLSGIISDRDNLLIFYAGHGVWDEKLNVGYWLPADSKSGSKANWLSNSTIRDYISGIPTRHTLLISDACFSGSIFKTREVKQNLEDYGFYKVYKLNSRKAMTSGSLDAVADKSVFMEYLVKGLVENERNYLPARTLFHEIETVVINNTTNVPQYGTIQNAGDEGGDFIFIKKKADTEGL